MLFSWMSILIYGIYIYLIWLMLLPQSTYNWDRIQPKGLRAFLRVQQWQLNDGDYIRKDVAIGWKDFMTSNNCEAEGAS